MKNPRLALLRILCVLLPWIGQFQNNYGWSSLAKNDPYPIFTTEYPYNWLLNSTKNYLKGIECEYCPSHFSVAFSGYYQKANRGSNYDRVKNLPLGDLEGRWHMLGMLYGPAMGPGFCPEVLGPTLQMDKEELFPGVGGTQQVPPARILADPNRMIGYFSAPIKYRKHGIRFEASFQPIEDVGFVVQGGYADIKQTLTLLENLGADVMIEQGENRCGFTRENVALINCLLMTPSNYVKIFEEQKLDRPKNSENICDFRKGSFEDFRFGAWIRHIFEINRCLPCDWPELLFIPFFNFEAQLAIEKPRDRTLLLSAPFGNDGHNAIGFTSGFHMDFFETVEIGFHGGITHFFGKHIEKYRLPTHRTQSGIYPFATDVFVQPGNNHHFAVLFHAYRFVDRLSAFIEFVFVNHDEDKITICDPEARELAENPDNPISIELGVFRVPQQECLTKFTSQFLTTGANYEISPSLSLGFAVQWPIQQRNAYRSTTIIGTLKGTF